MLDYRQRIANQHNPDTLSPISQDRRFDVHHATHAERVAVMLIQGDQVETQFLGVAILVEIVIVVVGCLLGIEELVGNCEISAIPQDLIFGQAAVRAFSEIADFHNRSPLNRA
jgi:hypothetical protein